MLRTIIAWPAPNAQNTGKAHGSALGDDEVAATKKVLGFDPDQTFEVARRRAGPHPQGSSSAASRPQAGVGRGVPRTGPPKPSADVALFERMQTRTLPDGWDADLPTFDADPKGVATRKASGAVINAIAGGCPSCGAARPTWPAPTTPPSRARRRSSPRAAPPTMWKGDPLRRPGAALRHPRARHGRDHERHRRCTAAPASSAARSSPSPTTCAAAVRLAALMGLPVTYVWTHDSIGLGEDGPTHQPIEHLAALRAIPGLDVVRPADANETAACWQAVLEHTDRPGRPDPDPPERPGLPPRRATATPTPPTCTAAATSCSTPTAAPPDVVLIGTGSEVQLAVEARELLAADGIAARVVSMPCREWFDEQEPAYRETVHPADGQGAGLGRGRHRAGLARDRRRPRPDRLDRAPTAPRPTTQRIYAEYGITGAGRRRRRPRQHHVAAG